MGSGDNVGTIDALNNGSFPDKGETDHRIDYIYYIGVCAVLDKNLKMDGSVLFASAGVRFRNESARCK